MRANNADSNNADNDDTSPLMTETVVASDYRLPIMIRVLLGAFVGWVLMSSIDYKTTIQSFMKNDAETDTNKKHAHPVFNVTNPDKYRRATVNTNFGNTSGCGFSIRVEVDGSLNVFNVDADGHSVVHVDNTTSPGPQRGFFKAQHQLDPYFFRGEFHLKEVISGYVDRLLGTNIVPPCVGFRLPLQPVRETSEEVMTDGACIIEEERIKEGLPNEDDLPATIGGSLMKWTEGDMEEVKHSFLRESAMDNSTELYDSALRYGIFHWIGGCIKTAHNYFLNTLDGKQGFVALDNDRCMQPSNAYYTHAKKKKYWKGIRQLEQWKTIVLETQCHNYPPEVVRNVMALRTSFGEELKKSLRKDVLADELLDFVPEAYEEINDRIALLAQRLEECGFS